MSESDKNLALHMDTRITLWCDSRSTQDEAPPSKKRKTDTCCQGSSEGLRELDNSEVIFKELKTRHPDLPIPKLRLWAKIIDRGRHEDHDNPPNIPLITGSLHLPLLLQLWHLLSSHRLHHQKLSAHLLRQASFPQ